MFGTVTDALAAFLNAPIFIWNLLLAMIVDFSTKITQWMSVFIGQTLPNLIAEQVPQTWVDFINQPVVTTLLDMVGDVFWFYPLIPVLVIYSNAYIIAAAVRIARYAIGFIPTVEG